MLIVSARVSVALQLLFQLQPLAIHYIHETNTKNAIKRFNQGSVSISFIVKLSESLQYKQFPWSTIANNLEHFQNGWTVGVSIHLLHNVGMRHFVLRQR